MNSMLDFFLIGIICFLLVLILALRSKINYMCDILDEVLKGNINQRIRIQNNWKPLSVLINKVNMVIESFQSLTSKNIENEESRKKMISNISHDLRTPLTSMLGYMELIFDNEEISEEKKQEYLKIIYDKGNSLYGLMEEFFQVSKLDSNDIKIEIEETNISEIIRQSFVSFFVEIQKYNIRPCINIGEGDIFILTDKKIIGRILNNLINNAIKHASKATEIGINLVDNDDDILLEVWDNGIGINKEEINHIFDRLYTVEKSRNLALKNSGLGLTIVKKLVDSLGGSIKVSSIPFKETKFSIKLSKKS
ncbi:MAG: HAMP domain-containing sensor histidine kinase [Clostridiaceae bacterium]|nr:HAMP domain-containing sensor histidine kinase [Clostridiaceae bacterium]